MTWVDGAFAAVVVISAAIAFFRGLVREVLSLGAWAGAAGGAFLARPHLQPYTSQWLDPPMLADAVGAGAVFLVLLVILKLVTNAIADRVQDSALGGLDRVLGLVFGAARGAVLLVIAYILAGMFAPETQAWPGAVKEARSLPLIAEAARRSIAHVPEPYRPRLVEPPGAAGPTVDDLLRPPARSPN
ncbi:CvpA family protein [Roseomonas sp. PWR1]|uniref:CvpA family protein n=1 Tax=Roseomonas nitratireducens TaxID=2820810 RepID=A0ABS4AUD0_9PROT|nr:CvpA family protein [Neoroseomonas nitratireducens]MBP0464458.1 CvpA family protein [Neoroseomonas nitratireducens]